MCRTVPPSRRSVLGHLARQAKAGPRRKVGQPLPTRNFSSWSRPQLERHLDLGSVGLYLAVLDLEIEFDHFGNAKVTKRTRSLLYGCSCSLLPGLLTSADEFNALVK